MSTNNLKELNEKITSLASALDAAIEDHFKFDNSGETPETAEIHVKLNLAWDSLDSALDDLECLIKGVTSLERKTDPAEPAETSEETLSLEAFRATLQNLTVENLREAHKAVVFFDNKLNSEKENRLSEAAKGHFIAALLIEYGRQKALKENNWKEVKKLDKHELTKMYSEVEQALKLTEGVKRRYFPAEEETETTMQIEEDLNEAMQILDNVLTNIDEMIRYQNN